MTSACVPHDRCGHNSNCAGSGNQHIFTKHGERQSSMDRIAERIEDRAHFRVNSNVMAPDVGHRQNDEFCEGPSAIYAYTLCLSAKMAASSQAITAASTNYVAFSADKLSGMKIGNVRSDLHDFAKKFVPNHQRNFYG